MAQIIKHRRGSITQLKDVTARVGELVVATGSISDLNGPMVFVGETEGVAGAYRPLSKIYQGAAAPTITVGSHGSVIDGTPFYASGNKTLYILSKDGNNSINLTGNIEGNVISGVTINNLTGTTANITNGNFTSLTSSYITGSSANITSGNFNNLTGATFTSTNSNITNLTGSTATLTSFVSASALNVTGNTQVGGTVSIQGTTYINDDLYITGNTYQTGSIDLTGNIKLGGNINIGDSTTDFVTFGAEVSSSIVPDVHNAFDLGSADKNWKDLHISGTAFVDTLQARQVNFSDLGILNDLSVSGSTYLGNGGDILVVSGSAYYNTLTNNRIVIAGTNGLLEDDANFTFDGTELNVGQGNFTVQQGNGNVDTAGTLNVGGATTLESSLTVTGSAKLKSTLEVVGATNLDSTLTVTGSATLKDNLSVSGTTTVSGATTLQNTLTVNSTSELKAAVGMNSTLDVTGSAQFKSTINVDGEATLASATVEDLTQHRVVVAGAGGALMDYSGFTFDNSKLQVGGGKFEMDVAYGDIRTSGSLTTKGNITVNGDETVNGILTVTGNTQLGGNLYVSGNLQVLGGSTSVTIQSQTVELDDNIIRLNAYSPFERYAGFEVIDSGSSGVSASMVWDSLNDYWMFVSSSGQSSKMVGTTAGTYGSEVSLTSGTFPIATANNTIGNSLLTYSGTTLAYNTNKFTVDSGTGAALIAGNVTLSAAGGTDAGNNTSAIIFRNSSNVLGYVSTTETTDVLDGILGYKNSDGGLVFSTVIDGGTY